MQAVARVPAYRPAVPFLKWAGGKRRLAGELRRRMPGRFGTYHEPFLGAGALFFALGSRRRAVLSDSNRRLIRTWTALRDSVDEVIALLRWHAERHGRGHFLELRTWDVDRLDDAQVAAWMIYLNRAGFNGLYRVNRKNRFNVPFGDNRGVDVVRPELLRACSAALDGVEILCEDFGGVAERAVAGDFVYFDPPYVPLSASSSFTAYQAGGFGPDDQRRLRDLALELKRSGVVVLLSNSSAPLVHELYGGGEFAVERVYATRRINSKASGRGAIAELLIS